MATRNPRRNPRKPNKPPANQAGPRSAGERAVLVEGDVGGAIVTGTSIVNNYYDHGGRQRDRNRLLVQIASYLNWVRAHYGQVELRGIERGGRKVLTLDLDQAYVSLEASVAAAPGEDGRAGHPGGLARPDREPIPLEDVLGLNNRIVVTGGPGCGKTTLLLHMAHVLASAILRGSDLARQRLGLERPLPLPIFVPLAAYARRLRELRRNPAAATRDRTLAAFISDYLIGRQADFDLPPDFFEQLLRDGRDVLLLLDGLDEVADEDERERVRQAVEELAAGRDELRLVVTCRTAAYRGRTALGGGFREVVVQPLDQARTREMVRRFYACVYPAEPGLVDAKTGELMDGLAELERQRRASQNVSRSEARREAQPLIDSPLMVRLLLIVHYNDRRMPQQRVELFMKAAEAMLQLEYLPDVEVQQELRNLVGSSWTKHYEMVQHLAFHMHRRGEEQGREIDEAALRAAFHDTDHAQCVEALLHLTRDRGGLLEERLGAYRFIHLGFQEYLAARHVIKVIGGQAGVQAMAGFFEGGPIADSWWREVALLIPGYCAADSNAGLGKAFLRRLAGLTRPADAPALPPEMQLAAAEVAASAALELRERDESLHADLAQRLAALYADSRVMTSTPPPLRVAAGVVLGRLGDPRLDVMDIDFMQFRWVPAGPFVMGSDPTYDTRALREEVGNTDPVDIPGFYISQYPVTCAQFGVFVKAGGYDEERYWDEARASGWWKDGSRRHRPRDYGAPYNLPNHPQVGITWYEALAFTHWLSERWDADVRLPNEAQWEKAARGGLRINGERVVITASEGLKPRTAKLRPNPEPQRVWSWQGEFDSMKANTFEAGLRATSAPGCFPNGMSPYGCLDMIGNVWEWCYDRYASYPYPVEGMREGTGVTRSHRVLRGGSFRDDIRSARCACRIRYAADGRNDHVGFRVVVFPSAASVQSRRRTRR